MPKLELNEEFELLTEEEEEKKENKQDEDKPTNTNEETEGEGTEEEEFDFGDEESEPEYTLSDIGKVYTLKQVYSSLNSLYNFTDSLIIDGNLDEDLIKIQEKIQEVKDLFLLIAYNIDKYLDKLDTIIDLLRKFIKTTTEELNKYVDIDNNETKEKSKSSNTSGNSSNKQ